MHDVKAVPFLDLSAQYKELEAEWFDAIRVAGQSGAFVLGPNVAAFEKEAGAYTGAAHTIGCANGTDALILSLRALDIGSGDEVITSPFTFFATAEAVTLVGAKPVFADIEADSYNIDPERIRERITPRTKAIIPVHLYGYPAKMDAIMKIAREHNLAVIEDCAQAFGAMIGDKRVGSFGDAGTFSFYPTKVLGCFGDGGLISTGRDDINERLRRLRNHGAYKAYMHNEIGYNSRLDEIQAAVLRIKLRHIERDIAARTVVATEYDRCLSALGIGLPARPSYGRHAFNIYTIRVKNRDRVRQVLTDNKIASSVYYPHPLHLQDVYQPLGYACGSMPISEQAVSEVLSLPIYPGMPLVYVERVADVLKTALKAAG